MCVKQGDLPGARPEFMLPVRDRRAGPAGVRASVVARKSRNGDGAKGTQEGGDVTDRTAQSETEPARVSETKQAGDIRARWAWVEATVWTERMLTALDEGVKGGKWFSLMDKVFRTRTLWEAFKKVKANGGAAGVDHQTVQDFEKDLSGNLERLSKQLREGSYRPQAIRRKWIPKPGSSEKRPLGIPTVRDRVVQAALVMVLEPIFEQKYAEQSYGFRPNRGCKDALRRVDQLLRSGYHWVVDADLKSYFDTIPHQPLMGQVEEEVADGRVLELIESYLKQQIMETAKPWTPEEGTPQGAVLSPLLSNLYLNPLDHLMVQKGVEMVRYADDFVLLCRSQEEAEAALQEIREWTGPAGLCLHPVKTRIVDVDAPGGFDFLGYRFERGKKWPREKSRRKFREAIRQKTHRTNGHSLQVIIQKVNRTVSGWFQYFKHSTRSTFRREDSWIRGRLRSILRKRCGRRGRARGDDHQRWPNAFFVEQGLFSLVQAHAAAVQSSKR
jgi:RNA-directed DNA polymerase